MNIHPSTAATIKAGLEQLDGLNDTWPYISIGRDSPGAHYGVLIVYTKRNGRNVPGYSTPWRHMLVQAPSLLKALQRERTELYAELERQRARIAELEARFPTSAALESST